jgi:hypothetical protein
VPLRGGRFSLAIRGNMLQTRAKARITAEELQALKDKYNAAHLTYRTAARARGATKSGSDDWDRLLEVEAKSLSELTEARAVFLVALTSLTKRESS